MKRLRTFLSELPLRAYVALQVFAATEPVRLRAALTSLVLAGAVFIPALATSGVAETVGAVGVVALPILVGESARRKVSPVS
jgi:hypothetical protein